MDLEHFDEAASHERPFVLSGTAAGTQVSAGELVERTLELRKGKVTMIPCFTQNVESPIFDASMSPTVLGDLAEAALEIMGCARRTLHPTHSWLVVGPRSEMHVVSGLYAMSPFGMGSPIFEVINMVGNAAILGGELASLPSIYAAEEMAKVPYALREGRTECNVTDSAGRSQEVSLHLRSVTEPDYNWARVKSFLLEEDCLQDVSWGLIASVRGCYDRLSSKLREDPLWLVSG